MHAGVVQTIAAVGIGIFAISAMLAFLGTQVKTATGIHDLRVRVAQLRRERLLQLRAVGPDHIPAATAPSHPEGKSSQHLRGTTPS